MVLRAWTKRQCAKKSIALASAYYCNIVTGAFTPVLAKHSTHFSLRDSLAICVDRIQRDFEPMCPRYSSKQTHPTIIATNRRLTAYHRGIRRRSMAAVLQGCALAQLPTLIR
jgi:hypothetical protein